MRGIIPQTLSYGYRPVARNEAKVAKRIRDIPGYSQPCLGFPVRQLLLNVFARSSVGMVPFGSLYAARKLPQEEPNNPLGHGERHNGPWRCGNTRNRNAIFTRNRDTSKRIMEGVQALELECLGDTTLDTSELADELTTFAPCELLRVSAERYTFRGKDDERVTRKHYITVINESRLIIGNVAVTCLGNGNTDFSSNIVFLLSTWMVY